MNINELENRTGITKQNIRFYEKKGLLRPTRNEQNHYREYQEADVVCLQQIKILRKLDLPIAEIRRIFMREETLSEAMREHEKTLAARQMELDACINICRSLQETELDTMDTAEILEKMDKAEQGGGLFASIIADYKKVARAEAEKTFSFMPDTMAMNPQEFTEALVQYAEKNKRELVMIRESMYPVFMLDGEEYTAERRWTRFGAYIQCTMTYPQTVEPAEVPEKRRKWYRFLYRYMASILLVLFLIATRGKWGVLLGIVLVPYLVWMFRHG